MVEREMEIRIPCGIGVASAARIAHTACQYESWIHLNSESRNVNAKSIMGLIGAGLAQGMLVTVTAEGQDEEEAVTALEAFLTGE